MRRIVFTVDVELSTEEFERDNDKSYFQEFDGAENGMSAINLHYNELLERHQAYAELCGADHKVFTRDENYALWFYSWLRQLDPDISHQQVINFYKLYCFDKLKQDYDEMLYLDLDVIVNTDDIIFDTFNFRDGMLMAPNNMARISTFYPEDSINRIQPTPDKRSVEVKYAMAHTLLLMDGITKKPTIWNTGVIGCANDHIEKLGMFSDDFDSLCESILDCRNIAGLYNEELQKNFCLNNEALLSYLTIAKEISVQQLSEDWHNIYDDIGELIPTSHFIHVVNKRFGDVL